MPFPILGSNSAVAEFAIDNSLRFNDDDSSKLTKTPSGDGDRQKWTVNCWFKRGNLTDGMLFSVGTYTRIQLSSNTIYVQVSNNNSTAHAIQTNRLFRDISAWYMITVSCDTTQGTASNRLKLYINGVEETSFSTDQRSDITQNISTATAGQFEHRIGGRASDIFYDGYIAEFNFIDGSQLTPSSFGETNDNGVWIPKTYEGTYGTNGFFLEFKNSGSLGTDTSGNGNDFTATNLTATDQTTDTPTNNFCTFNPIFTGQRGTFSEGNTKLVTNVQGSANFGQSVLGTFLLSSGKWYWEIECDAIGSGGNVGIGANERVDGGAYSNGSNSLGSTGNSNYNSSGSLRISAETPITSGVSSYTSGDIIGVALDLDNSKIYWSKNGSWQASGDPSNNSNGISLTSSYNDNWVPFCSKDDTTNNATFIGNFGNPPTTISSGNADANGYGNFEYAVPSGFYSLCTKNLAEYG